MLFIEHELADWDRVRGIWIDKMLVSFLAPLVAGGSLEEVYAPRSFGTHEGGVKTILEVGEL